MLDLFRTHSSYPKNNAQANLRGRTNYVNDDTLRYFRARILSTYHTDSGLLFAMVESCSGDFEHKTRICRPVIFDVFGNVLHRPKLEESFRTRPQAERAMWKALDAIDAKQVTLEALATRRRQTMRELDDLEAKVCAL
jgi:hypothetical protein